MQFTKPRVCPSCGKLEPIEGDFIAGFCRDCFLDRHELAAISTKLVLTRCPVCKRFHFTEWQEGDDKALCEWASEKLKLKYPLVNLRCDGFVGDNSGRAKLHAVFNVHGSQVEQTYNVFVKFHATQCRECSREASGYFEVIVQVRRKNESTTDEKIERAVARLSRELEANDSYIVKELPSKHGVDLRVSKISAAFTACHALFGHVERSKKLIGRKNGKNIYKHTLCVRV